MIINDPYFQKKLKMYHLFNCFEHAIVIANSPKRAKKVMVEYTSRLSWENAEDFEIIITGEEQIVSESI